MLCTSRKKIKFLCHNLGDGSICGGGGGSVTIRGVVQKRVSWY